MRRSTPARNVEPPPPWCTQCGVPIRLPDHIKPDQVALMWCETCTIKLMYTANTR